MSAKTLSAKSELELAFLEDHQHLLKGLTEILERLGANDLGAAVAAAERVDEAVGPHMRFEEEELYPTLRAVLGNDYVNRLYDEHTEGQQAIAELRSRGPEPLTEDEKARLMEAVETTLNHAVSCGTLLSHLDALDEARQSALLERLVELRHEKQLWSDYGR